MLTRKPFYYLRHGQTDWNKQGRYQGRQDVPLNAAGVAQARTAKDLLRGHSISTICCSPLSRARRTAEIVNEELNKPLVVIDELQECSYGELEGQTKTGPHIDAEWRRGITPPGAEPYGDFAARVLDGVNRALAQPGPVLIVAHRAVYWPVQSSTRLTGDGELPNAHPVRLYPSSEGTEAWCAQLLSWSSVRSR